MNGIVTKFSVENTKWHANIVSFLFVERISILCDDKRGRVILVGLSCQDHEPVVWFQLTDENHFLIVKSEMGLWLRRLDSDYFNTRFLANQESVVVDPAKT
ncbi:hypothetical protein OGAPHI_005158 [Ogataea philodendri]|uniref:Uncharacterized protein n=1 Tax=Ogataea philodendri TaxID=1378263 RepID=A0A9P8T3F6_9ASCO|nr:uncharacterized protein OGAPHI_005158 [Ogataea philodendri]KAH3663756.1 hypothetical protein OGAPHI_005158 [Ogataea philodendri]